MGAVLRQWHFDALGTTWATVDEDRGHPGKQCFFPGQGFKRWPVGERAGWLCSVIDMSLHAQVKEYIAKKVLPEEAPARKLLDRGGEGLVSSQHQWHFNLLTHVESLQDEVTHRMDSIEKELDGRVPFLASLVLLLCCLLKPQPGRAGTALFLPHFT